MIRNVFKSGIFPLPPNEGRGLPIYRSTGLPIALAQVKSGNTSKNLLN